MGASRKLVGAQFERTGWRDAAAVQVESPRHVSAVEGCGNCAEVGTRGGKYPHAIAARLADLKTQSHEPLFLGVAEKLFAVAPELGAKAGHALRQRLAV